MNVEKPVFTLLVRNKPQNKKYKFGTTSTGQLCIIIKISRLLRRKCSRL